MYSVTNSFGLNELRGFAVAVLGESGYNKMIRRSAAQNGGAIHRKEGAKCC